jgi:hypothetical protein
LISSVVAKQSAISEMCWSGCAKGTFFTSPHLC